MLSYWFYPNLGTASYGHPKVLTLLILSVLLFAGSFAVEFWRKRRENPVTRKLSRTWPITLRWFGGMGIVLVVSRAEGIQFLSMRILWVTWALGFLAFALFQAWKFRLKHYTVVPRQWKEDPREKYLPKGG